MFPFCVLCSQYYIEQASKCVAVIDDATVIIKNDRWEGKTEPTLTSATP